MNDPNRNARWCRLIAEETRRGGVSHVVLCPGSRNSPLLFALASAFGDATISHLDERSAGFLAIGLMRATGAPVAVCVTSGSALANLLPAVCEAAAAELPLIVISADRPWEAHDCGAPQTMPQRGILTAFLKTELAIGEPSDDERALRALRRGVARLVQTAHGPTHLNVPLRDPLPPLPDANWQPPVVSPAAQLGRAEGFTERHQATLPAPLTRAAWMRPGLRGVIVAGCLSSGPVADSPVTELARRTGFPLLADGPSHLRRLGTPGLVTTFDALVTGPFAQERPELVIQIGQAPVTRAAYEWLERADCPWISCATEANLDFLGRAWLSIDGTWGPALAQLGDWLAPGDAAWAARWQAAEQQARRTLDAEVERQGWGEPLIVHRALAQPGFAFVHLASSMAVRYANLHLAASHRPVHSNRGVNGIDGTLGTFLGACHGHRAPGVLLVGDLAFLHDLPALTAASLGLGAIVVLNNGGGGIFDFLPVAQVPQFDRLIRTSHQRTLAGAATLFDLPYHVCRDEAALLAALAAATAGRLHLIECLVTPGAAVAQHRALLQACAGVDDNAPGR